MARGCVGRGVNGPRVCRERCEFSEGCEWSEGGGRSRLNGRGHVKASVNAATAQLWRGHGHV
eukprot:scaffold15578_cov126-Isochrysis_galbana.AAC.1